jgi:hypothetical protein
LPVELNLAKRIPLSFVFFAFYAFISRPAQIEDENGNDDELCITDSYRPTRRSE